MAEPLDGAYFELTGDNISDLFLNARHPNYDALMAQDGEPPELDMIGEAICQDAVDFAKLLPVGSALGKDGINRTFTGSRLVDALAHDFLIRMKHIES